MLVIDTFSWKSVNETNCKIASIYQIYIFNIKYKVKCKWQY